MSANCLISRYKGDNCTRSHCEHCGLAELLSKRLTVNWQEDALIRNLDSKIGKFANRTDFEL